MVDKTIYALHPITGELVPVGQMNDKDYVVSADVAYLETACRTYQLRAEYYFDRTQEMRKLLESVMRDYQGDGWEDLLIQIEHYLDKPTEKSALSGVSQETLDFLKKRVFFDDGENVPLDPEMLRNMKLNVRPGKGTLPLDDEDL